MADCMYPISMLSLATIKSLSLPFLLFLHSVLQDTLYLFNTHHNCFLLLPAAPDPLSRFHLRPSRAAFLHCSHLSFQNFFLLMTISSCFSLLLHPLLPILFHLFFFLLKKKEKKCSLSLLFPRLYHPMFCCLCLSGCVDDIRMTATQQEPTVTATTHSAPL